MRQTICRFIAAAIIFATSAQASADYKGRPQSYNYQHGIDAIGEENYEEAIFYFEKELKEDPKNGYAYAGLIAAYRHKQEYGKMLDAATLAEKYIPKKDKEYVRYIASEKAFLHLYFGDTIKAIETASRAIKLVPEDNNLIELRGAIYSSSRQWEKSNADYRHLVDVAPGSSSGYYGLGSNAYKQRQISEAIRWFNEALRVDPERAAAYSFRALCYKEMGKWDEATTDWCTALQKDFSERSTFYNMLTLEEPAHTMMVTKLKVQARRDRTNSMWPYCIAYTLEGHDQLEEAIKYYKKCDEIQSSATALYRIASCQELLGRYHAAMVSIERALAMEPDDKDYRAYKANLLYELGRPQEAINEFENLLDDEPEFAWAYYRCGWFKHMTGDINGALEDLTAAIVLNPQYAYAYESRGRVYQEQREYELSRADYLKAIELEKEANDYNCSHYAHLALGHREQAVAVMDTILARNKNSKGSLYDAACLYSLMGEKDKALNYLEQSLKKGYRRFAHMRLDSDLDAIRNMPRYLQLIKQYDIPETIDQDEIKSMDELKAATTAFGSTDKAAPFGTAAADTPQSGTVPFTKSGGVCKVECEVNDLPLHFIFDTGAADVTISSIEALFMYKNGYIGKRDFVGNSYYMDANGDISEGTVINLRKVTFAGYELDNVRASVVHNQRAPLLLGQSVLGRLGRIEIDNRARVIRITPVR